MAFHLSRFAETVADGLNMLKAFGYLSQMFVLKLLSNGFYNSVCTLIFNLFSGQSIFAIVDGHSPTPKRMKSCIPHPNRLSGNKPISWCSTTFFLNSCFITIIIHLNIERCVQEIGTTPWRRKQRELGKVTGRYERMWQVLGNALYMNSSPCGVIKERKGWE